MEKKHQNLDNFRTLSPVAFHCQNFFLSIIARWSDSSVESSLHLIHIYSMSSVFTTFPMGTMSDVLKYFVFPFEKKFDRREKKNPNSVLSFNCVECDSKSSPVRSEPVKLA